MKSDCLARELVEYNERIASDLISDKLGSVSESKVQVNGSHGVENMKEFRAHVVLMLAVSTPTPTRKGFALMLLVITVVAQDSPHEGYSNLSNWAQKSEDFLLSTNDEVRNFDCSVLYDDSSLGLSSSFVA